MNIIYKKTTFDQCEEYFLQYISSLSNLYDNFLEDCILESEFYNISIDGENMGYFAIQNEIMVTQFFVLKNYITMAQYIFEQIIESFHLTCAFVPTCDELFLSLCMDKHKKIEMQAYFFTDSVSSVKPPNFPRDSFRLLPKEEWDKANVMTDGFFDEITMDKVMNGEIIYEIYELIYDGEILGYGLCEDARIFKNCQTIGMYTIPKHREKGVGRSIILFLKDICTQRGKKALPGCWYYNNNSKRTLESSGFISKTRLLKIFFHNEINQ